jgi:hypothetical protein
VAYRGHTVLATDRAQWIVSIAGLNRPVRARIGAGMEPVVDEPTVNVLNLSGVSANVRNVAGMELPAQLFGNRRFKAGDTVELDATFVAHGRAHRVAWRGRFTLRGR